MRNALFGSNPAQLRLAGQFSPVQAKVGEDGLQISLLDQEFHGLNGLYDDFGAPAQSERHPVAIHRTVGMDRDVDTGIVWICVLVDYYRLKSALWRYQFRPLTHHCIGSMLALGRWPTNVLRLQLGDN